MIAKTLISLGFVAVAFALCGHWPLFVSGIALITAGQYIRMRA